jgi:DNA-binding transcriptional LysR family regulator
MALSLESLEVLDAIERKGSFAAAAHEMGKVPSALTYVVRKLEEDLDVLLFDRRRHRAELTPAGRALLDEGRHLLRAADDLERRVKRLATGWESTLSIVVDDLIHFRALLPVIQDFYADNDATRLRFSKEVFGGTWDALISNRADLLIGGASDIPTSQGFQTRPLGQLPFVFVVATHHPLASVPGPLSGPTIAQHRIVAVGDTSRNLPARTHGIMAGQDVLVVPTMQAKVDAQVRGLGCGWLPAPLAQPHIEAGTLIHKETIELREAGNFQMAWRTSNRGKALQWWVKKLEDPRLAEALIQATL